MLSLNDNPGIKDTNDLKNRLKKPATGASRPSSFGGGGGFGGGSAGFGISNNQEPETPAEVTYDYVEPDAESYKPIPYDPDLRAYGRSGKTIVTIVVVAIVLAAAFAGGFVVNGIVQNSSYGTTRAGIGMLVQKSTKNKIENFEKFYEDLQNNRGKVSDFSYNENFHNATLKTFKDYDFALDISSEIPSEYNVLDMGSTDAEKPVALLRSYSSKTLLLAQLISEHMGETQKDMQEIKELTEEGEKAGNLYAVRFDSPTVTAFSKLAGRLMFAMDATGVYRVIRSVGDNDDEEVSEIWGEMKKKMKADEIQALTYVPDKKAKGAEDEEALDLPKLKIYEIQAVGSSKKEFVFADEIILLNGDKLLISGEDAVTRYKARLKHILALADEIHTTGQALKTSLDNIAGASTK